MSIDTIKVPDPILDKKESHSIDTLSKEYERLNQPGVIAKYGGKVLNLVPESLKEVGRSAKEGLSDNQVYLEAMKIIASGFNILEKYAAQATITENQILKKINSKSDYNISSIEELCLVRSYDIEKAISGELKQNLLAAVIEGGATGVFGFPGLPFNIVLSTFLYYRAVQSIAMFYGYDVKNDPSELVIASSVFTSALSPAKSETNNPLSTTVAKIMAISEAEVVKQTAGKGWANMIGRGGIPLLIAQMRALANKAAAKALQKAGAKGLENSMFKNVFEQLGRRLTLKAVGKAIPVISGGIGALMDTHQMSRILNFANVFYCKRFLIEKESRIAILLGEEPAPDHSFDDEILSGLDDGEEEIIDVEIVEDPT